MKGMNQHNGALKKRLWSEMSAELSAQCAQLERAAIGCGRMLRFSLKEGRPGVHLCAWLGEEEGLFLPLFQCAAAKQGWRARWDKGFVNLHCEKPTLDRMTDHLASICYQKPLEFAWECDFSAVPYALARLEMECWIQRHQEPMWGQPLPAAAAEIVWLLISLPAWPTAQQGRKTDELAWKIVNTLDGQVYRDERTRRWLPVWRVALECLREYRI